MQNIGPEAQELVDKLQLIRTDFFDQLENASSDALIALESRCLGKGGELSSLSRHLYNLGADGKRQVGEAINQVRQEMRATLDERRDELQRRERVRAAAAEAGDITEFLVGGSHRQIGSLHVVTQTREALEDVFVGMGFSVADGPEVETEWHNFEALNIPKFHPARDSQDSFFVRYGVVESSVVMRTHTSPVQIRLMVEGTLPIYSVMPGRVFRRDTPDARHTPAFYQIEGLVVDRGITFANLADTVATFTSAYFGPGISSRLRPAFFPFTEPSAEFEITCTICLGEGCRTCSGTGWIELGGCGMVHPNVFRAVGIDAEQWSGFAFGFGIDRLAQMKHNISDMRIFLDNDVRFLRQFRG